VPIYVSVLLGNIINIALLAAEDDFVVDTLVFIVAL
jgi:hypothetical protein